MLRLKIGKNYLMIHYCHNDISLIDKAIPYMMGCFSGSGCLAIALTEDTFNRKEIISSIEELRAKTIYFLEYIPYLKYKKESPKIDLEEFLEYRRLSISKRINELKTVKPDLNIKVINVNAFEQKASFQMACSLYESLKKDPDNILSSLKTLDMYKRMTKRYAAIPGEVKIVDNDLKKLSKKTAVCDRIDTVDSLSYLKLIKSAEKRGSNLRCRIHKLPIYPSEDLGLVFEPMYFRDNPYLFKAASYIYQGCHFGMPETIIEIDASFRLHFIDVEDDSYNNMFRANNWSAVGYPHFGNGGFCPGEFNDTMAHAKEYGLGYYFTCLKQYLTTANMRDTAGIRVWWYPIYNDEGELVYCAGMDALLNEYVRRRKPDLYEELKDKSWSEIIPRIKEYGFDSDIMRYGAGRTDYHYHGPDAFLQVCKEKDEELYNKIMEGMKN